MQVGGIGSGNSGLGDHGVSHHVTNCIHEHDAVGKQTGGAAGLPASAASFSVSGENQTAAAPSLWDNLRNLMGSGKRLLGRIWGENADGDNAAGNAAAGGAPAGDAQIDRAGLEAVQDVIKQSSMEMSAQAQMGSNSQAQVLSDVKRQHEAHIAAASSSVHAPQNMIDGNPYFTTNSDTGKVKETLLQRVRIRFRDIIGQFTRRFGGRLAGQFSAKSNLADGRQRSRQDLRKKSRYRENDVEIDCVLTDDSYLMDSYDRRGEYSRLTTEHKRK